MAKYRPIDCRLWHDRKFLSLDQDSRMLWLFFLTSPFTLPIPGVIVAGEAAIAEFLEWSPERFRERFRAVSHNLAVKRSGRLIWLVNATKYQPPANPNVVAGWAKSWDDVPECDLKLEVWEALKIVCKPWSRTFDKLFAKPFANGSDNRSEYGYTQDQDQKQDQNQKQEQDQRSDSDTALPVGSSELLALKAKVDAATGDVGRRRARSAKKPRTFTPEQKAIAMRVLGKLGECNGVAYTGSDAHVGLIVDRLNDGIHELELRAIVAYCASPVSAGGKGWEGSEEMRQYLCPETLFGPKTHTKYLDPARTKYSKQLAEALSERQLQIAESA